MNLQISCLVRTLAFKTGCLALLAAGLLACKSAQAQNSSELAATYGRGVHAYFDNQTGLAEEYFSRVIRAGSTDPRAYYYRAMTRMRSGRQQEAEDDMRIGATYEASNPGNRHAIGKALERVQGTHRRLLERYRQQARMDRLQQRQQQTHRRYEQLQKREPAVLRREMPVPLEQLVEPSPELSPQPGSSSASPLPGFAAPAAKETAPAEAAPAPSPEAERYDPFVEGPADDDIFGEPESQAPEAVPISEPEPRAEPAEEDDLFGAPDEATDPAPIEDDPFGDPEPDEKDEETVQEEDDPFAATGPSADSEEDSSDQIVETAPETEPSMGQIQPSDQIESGQMVGILGRVVGSLFPWRSMEIPSMGSGPGAEEHQAGGVELGPIDDEQPEVVQVSAAEPIEGDTNLEDFFGEAADDSPSEAADDPFGAEAVEEEPASPTDAAKDESSANEETEPETDDPFGEF